MNDYCVRDQANSELSHGSSKAAITIKHWGKPAFITAEKEKEKEKNKEGRKDSTFKQKLHVYLDYITLQW